MQNEQVLLIARDGELTDLLRQALSARFPLEVILEEPPSKPRLIRSRIRRLGLWRVMGQMLFQLLAVLPMRWASRQRRKDIIRQAGFDPEWTPSGTPPITPSVNSTDCLERVRAIDPKVIVINGTRILKGSTLEAFGVPVLNVHVGITPKYRGVHGGYWALANKDPEHCGVTVHFVDPGIDTGARIAQATIRPTKRDNFTTYPTLQMVAGCELLTTAITDVLAGQVTIIQQTSESNRWYHPTLWGYLFTLFRAGVK